MDTTQRKSLPDSAYAFPRVRKEPLNDARHVRNAIARFDQVRDVSDAERAEAFSRIRKAAKRFGIEMTERRWQDLGKPSAAMRSSDKPRRTKVSRDDLYAEAKKRDIRGRSAMTKAELIAALGR